MPSEAAEGWTDQNGEEVAEEWAGWEEETVEEDLSSAVEDLGISHDDGGEGNRFAKAAERDDAIKMILARSSRTLRAALGMDEEASDADIKRRALKLLRLLHPDFSINIPLKGTKRHARIEGAFKKLSVLRDASE